MDDFSLVEETSFIVDEVSLIIKEAIENTVGGSAYQQNRVNRWSISIVEATLSHLAKLEKPFKYIEYYKDLLRHGRVLERCHWCHLISLCLNHRGESYVGNIRTQKTVFLLLFDSMH
uniref:Dynein light chain Tctex-type 1-like isoform X1 n=1 Tax=Geotrypetes seraphini TaxID=260995 RepID=A0A6P8Q7L6_GEOSA|nr:dynein light chain Tctex-type 1-like isoform X1 [Geotrypetes seraphini]